MAFPKISEKRQILQMVLGRLIDNLIKRNSESLTPNSKIKSKWIKDLSKKSKPQRINKRE